MRLRLRKCKVSQFDPPTKEEWAKVREWASDVEETQSAMMAELGAHWPEGPGVRGIRRYRMRVAIAPVSH